MGLESWYPPLPLSAEEPSLLGASGEMGMVSRGTCIDATSVMAVKLWMGEEFRDEAEDRCHTAGRE